MIKNNKVTIEKLATTVANGFKELKYVFKDDLATTGQRLTAKIEAIDVKQIKHKHV